MRQKTTPENGRSGVPLDKIVSCQDLAKTAYRDTHLTAPPDVPTWEQLHRVERDYLVKFTRKIVEIFGN
jgi:hypothetical protein